MTDTSQTDYVPYVLVVDDDWMNREIIEAYLKTAGYQVGLAHSGERALEMAFEQPPDLVMLDIRMPGMTGYDVCRYFKRDPRTWYIPVVMVTALEADEDKLAAIQAGADDFVTKPFNSLLMLTRVKSLLRIKRLHDEVEARNRLLRQVLSHYVAEDVTKVILSDPEKYLQLGGETRMVTVFFADIRGFTAFAEQHTANQVITALNQIFSELTDIVFSYKGTFDKYIGDEIMAFFGAPVATEDDTINALNMALDMRRMFNEHKAQAGDFDLHALNIGIGLHSGEAAVGNVGSERVMNYTVIGDTVNTARRLQQTAAPGQILISEDTFRLVEGRVAARCLEARQLSGKRELIVAYELHDVFN
ncbi:MAG: response regulator [Anaerolineae bacterium]|nr:response regulator [Anaerolineae bacterium]